MLKKSGVVPTASLGMTCASCLYHTRAALYSAPCANLGVAPFALAPSCFKPDTAQLATEIPVEFLNTLGRVCSDLDPDSIRLLGYTLASVAHMQEMGLKFGQPVYFSLGGDFLTHYFKGFVVARTDEVVTVTSKLNSESPTTLHLLPTSVLSKPSWRKKVQELVRLNRIFAPRTGRKVYLADLIDFSGNLSLPEVTPLDYEPPTLDNAPVEVVLKSPSVKSKRGKPKTLKVDTEADGTSTFEILTGVNEK